METRFDELGLIPLESQNLQRRVLRDDALQAEFDDKGYVIVPLIDANEVATLVDGYWSAARSAEGLNPEGAYNDTYAEFSVIHSRPDFRRTAFDLISGVLTQRANEHLVDYRPLVANFVNKPPGTGVVPAHQNWSVVDEARFQSVSVWVALVDCVVENGTMLMGDGSHRQLRGPRGMWAYQAYGEIEQELIAEFLTPVFVRAGEAVILDDAVVHYSPPNSTDTDRLAIQFVMVPEEAESVFPQQVAERDGVREVDVWRVEADFFFEFWHGDGDARFGTVVERVELPIPRMDIDLFRTLMNPSAPRPPATAVAEDDARDDAEAGAASQTPSEHATRAGERGRLGQRVRLWVHGVRRRATPSASDG